MSRLLNQGIYDAHEVAHLLAGEVERVTRWATPDAHGNPPIARPSHGRAFTFQGFASLAIAFEIRRRGVPEAEIRRGLQVLRVDYGVEHPLAHQVVLETLWTSGNSLLVHNDDGWFDLGKGRQGAIGEVVALYLQPLTFDEQGVASAWSPSPFVRLDPRIQAGAPCIAGTRIPTATIHELLTSASIEDVAAEYELSVEQVAAANAFERRLDEGFGLAA